MFLDRITLQLKAGNGGDGSVHFARVKYQPFAGPDGGDGGKGGSVVLLADRATDTLYHLRTAETTAKSGANGAGNLKIGATAPDLIMRIPVGTVVYAAETGDELAALTAGGQRHVAAKGGDGGKGNPKYATGRRRTPRIAESGAAGEELSAELIYRLYCDSLLIETEGDTGWQLLPGLAGREAEEIDWELYRRRPRWLRLEHDFRKFDCGYIPCQFTAEQTVEDDSTQPPASWQLHCPLIAHAYWARHICINLSPLEGLTPEAAHGILELLSQQELRRVERITLLHRSEAVADFSAGAALMQSAGAMNSSAAVDCIAANSPEEVRAAFLQQLTGDIVV